MTNTEDQLYIERVKRGDSFSFSFLVDKYKHMAYTIAMKIMRNEEDAEDAAQEGFIRAYQQIHTFQGKSKFSTWLYTIIYRVSISKWKENKLSTSSLDNETSESYNPDHAIPQLEQLHAQQQQWYIKKAVDRLPPTEGLLVTLFYMDDKSVKEIQEITGFSLANIKVKLFRARKKLERELQFLLQHETMN
jgi:RNA polymerase sigma-70 factor (ECF subfamily)